MVFNNWHYVLNGRAQSLATAIAGASRIAVDHEDLVVVPLARAANWFANAGQQSEDTWHRLATDLARDRAEAPGWNLLNDVNFPRWWDPVNGVTGPLPEALFHDLVKHRMLVMLISLPLLLPWSTHPQGTA